MSAINSTSCSYDRVLHAFSSCFSKKSVMITVAVALSALALIQSTSSTATLQRQATLITGCALGLLGIYLFSRYYFKNTPIEEQEVRPQEEKKKPKTQEELLRERRQQAVKERSRKPNFSVALRSSKT